MSDERLEFCRECRDEFHAGERSRVEAADFILWGKLFPQEALGPRCYDHAERHIGGAGMSRLDQYAVFDLRKVVRRPAAQQEQGR